MQPQGANPADRRGKVTAGLSRAAVVVLVLYPLLMYFGQSRLGVTWMALPDTGRLPSDDPGKASSHATCAHVLRPRALLRPGRNRIRV